MPYEYEEVYLTVTNPDALNLSAPILFLARGHSGTSPLTKFLEASGVYVGNVEDENCLNVTYDSLYFTFEFQRSLLPRLFKYGAGCVVDEREVTAAALKCLKNHLAYYSGGRWGFKTCAGMFSHPLYNYIFPNAKYIYIVRDGRDVILSGGGNFHLSHPKTRKRFWEYFKIITFGISNDVQSCPFEFSDKPRKNDAVIQNRFWIQAKSWREHVRMMKHLEKTGRLSPNVHPVRYEELCSDPIPVLEKLSDFLDLEFTPEVQSFSKQLFHAKSIGRWKNYKQFINPGNEDMAKVFASMEPELEMLGYTE